MNKFTLAAVSTVALLAGSAAYAAGFNTATTDQIGTANVLDLTQTGVDGTATIRQDGSNNGSPLGRDATSTQSGRSNTLTIQQTGNDNGFTTVQSAGVSNTIDLTQKADQNFAKVGQSGGARSTTTVMLISAES